MKSNFFFLYSKQTAQKFCSSLLTNPPQIMFIFFIFQIYDYLMISFYFI